MTSSFPKFLSTMMLLFFATNASTMTLPITKTRLFEVHSALFDAYDPFADETPDTHVKHLLQQIKASSFLQTEVFPELNSALFLLNHLHILHYKYVLRAIYRFVLKDPQGAQTVTRAALRPVREYIHSLPNHGRGLSIIDLSQDERLKLFSILISSDVNLLRQVGFYMRMLYTNAIYGGGIGQQISQIPDPGHYEADIIPALPTFKTHLTYNEKKKRIEGRIDAAIIGSGPSGSVAAYELQRHGFKVLVVEAGPLVIPGSMDTRSHIEFMEGGMPRPSTDGSVALLNGEAVGGGTTVNLDMVFPPVIPQVIHRFHDWHARNLIPKELWTDEELLLASSWVNTIFETRFIDDDEINKNNEILLNGARALNMTPRKYQLNSYKIGTSPHKVTNKRSAFDRLLLPAMTAAKNPVTLLHECRVTKVLIKHGKAYGFDCVYEPKHNGVGIVHDLYDFKIKPGTKIRIKSDYVMLAAGNLGTSGILLRSKIENPNIGRGFVVHPFISLMGTFDHEIRADQGEPSTILVDELMPTDTNTDVPNVLLETGLGRLSIWSLMVPGTPKQVRDVFSNIRNMGGFSVLLADTPNNGNRVKVDRHGKLSVHYNFLEQDKRRMIEGLKTAVKVFFAAGAKDVTFNTFEPILFRNGGLESTALTPDMDIEEAFKDFELTPNRTSVLAAHMMGGNKLGMNAETAVVGGDYQVFGVNGLYVIDSSVFPTSVGANPMETVYVTAKIFVDNFISSHFKN